MKKANSTQTTVPSTFPWSIFADVYCGHKKPFIPAKIPPTAPDSIKMTGVDKRILENLCLIALYKKNKGFEKIFFFIKTNWKYDLPSLGFIDGKIAYVNDIPVMETGIDPQHKEVLEQKILPHLQKAVLQSQ